MAHRSSILIIIINNILKGNLCSIILTLLYLWLSLLIPNFVDSAIYQTYPLVNNDYQEVKGIADQYNTMDILFVAKDTNYLSTQPKGLRNVSILITMNKFMSEACIFFNVSLDEGSTIKVHGNIFERGKISFAANMTVSGNSLISIQGNKKTATRNFPGGGNFVLFPKMTFRERSQVVIWENKIESKYYNGGAETEGSSIIGFRFCQFFSQSSLEFLQNSIEVGRAGGLMNSKTGYLYSINIENSLLSGMQLLRFEKNNITTILNNKLSHVAGIALRYSTLKDIQSIVFYKNDVATVSSKSYSVGIWFTHCGIVNVNFFHYVNNSIRAQSWEYHTYGILYSYLRYFQNVSSLKYEHNWLWLFAEYGRACGITYLDCYDYAEPNSEAAPGIREVKNMLTISNEIRAASSNRGDNNRGISFQSCAVLDTKWMVFENNIIGVEGRGSLDGVFHLGIRGNGHVSSIVNVTYLLYRRNTISAKGSESMVRGISYLHSDFSNLSALVYDQNAIFTSCGHSRADGIIFDGVVSRNISLLWFQRNNMTAIGSVNVPSGQLIHSIRYISASLESVSWLLFSENVLRNEQFGTNLEAVSFYSCQLNNLQLISWINNSISMTSRDSYIRIVQFQSGSIKSVGRMEIVRNFFTTNKKGGTHDNLGFVLHSEVVGDLADGIVFDGNTFSMITQGVPVVNKGFIFFQLTGAISVTYRCNVVNGISVPSLSSSTLLSYEFKISDCGQCNSTVDCFPSLGSAVLGGVAPFQCQCSCGSADNPSCLPNALLSLKSMFESENLDYGPDSIPPGESDREGNLTSRTKTLPVVVTKTNSIVDAQQRQMPSRTITAADATLENSQTLTKKEELVVLPQSSPTESASHVDVDVMDISPSASNPAERSTMTIPIASNVNNSTTSNITTTVQPTDAEGERVIRSVAVLAASPAEEATITVTVSTAALSAVMVGSAAAATEIQTLAVMGWISCADKNVKSATKGSRWMVTPLQLTSGPAGYLLGNLVLVFCVIIIHGFLATFLKDKQQADDDRNGIDFAKRTMKSGSSIPRAFARLQFPSKSISLWNFAIVGISLETFRIFQTSNAASTLSIIVAILSIVLIVASCGGIVWFKMKILPQIEYIEYKHVPLLLPSWLRPIVAQGYWSRGQVKGAFGTLLGPFRGKKYVIFGLLPTLRAAATGLISSFSSTTEKGCRVQYFCLGGLSALISLVLFICRPSRQVFRQVLSVITNLLLAFVVAAPAISTLGSYTNHFITALSVISTVAGALSIFMALLERFWMSKKERAAIAASANGIANTTGQEDGTPVDDGEMSNPLLLSVPETERGETNEEMVQLPSEYNPLHHQQ